VAAVTTNTAGDIDVSMVDMATGTVQHEFVVHGATFLDFIRNDTELVATGTVPAPDGSGQLEVVRFIDVATAQQIGEPLIVSATPTTPSEALLYLNSAAAEVADVTGTRFQTSPSSPGQGVVQRTPPSGKALPAASPGATSRDLSGPSTCRASPTA
jgi:hypothetical protein